MSNDILKSAKIHHIALRVKDAEQAKKFYIEGLGMKLKAEWKQGDGGKAAMIEIGDGGIFEIFDGPKAPLDEGYDFMSGQFFHVAIAVEDVDAAFNRALQYGAKPRSEPKDVDIPASPAYPVRIAFVFGPSGECVEFFKER